MSNMRLADLAAAFAAPLDPEAISKPLAANHWELLAGFLTPTNLMEGETLFQRYRDERSLYFLESGRVTIHYENEKGTLRVALVSSGTVFGEASFLGNMPRQASAQVATAGRAWQLSRLKFTELYQRHPSVALDVVQLASATLARRSRDARRRRAIA
ncbi:Crp/Fnr family transcriptional regulator [Vandammella animalimorsus]|uniref:Crp/Fnr family transcriptional regulator n=1 Tax=Vandammella animalimorsus TaxID=2029117 RepID=A0A2A2AF71_9BURK|nr:cyclic nucleotide-binding domain-containing protein [Vandammella animalimorsus]PAT36447.1 Crp/Fnr family transcriptional regulator [Vandammella animalimorsus]